MNFRKFLDYIILRTKDGKEIHLNENDKDFMYRRYKLIKRNIKKYEK